MDSSTSKCEASEKVYPFVYIFLFLSFGICFYVYICLIQTENDFK